MEKSLIHFVIPFPAGYKPTVVAEPSDRSLNLPATFVTTKRPSVLRFWFLPIASMGRYQLNTLCSKPISKLVRVVRFVADQTLGFFANVFQGFISQLHFRRTGRVNGHSQRNTLAVSQYHELCAFSPLGFADFGAPFLAGTKLPSIKHSPHWIRPLLSKVSMNLRHILSQVPSSSHIFRRFQQVLGLGYFSGRSFQRAPVRKIQRMPSKTNRVSRQGRPLLFSFGSNGSIAFHCFSVKYIARLIGLPPMNLCIGNHL